MYLKLVPTYLFTAIIKNTCEEYKSVVDLIK